MEVFAVLDQSSIPGLRPLAQALSEALPDDDPGGDPQYLARSALDICLAGNWSGDELLLRQWIAPAGIGRAGHPRKKE